MSASPTKLITFRRTGVGSLDARRMRLVASLAAVMVALLALGAGSASAASGRQQIGAFGPDGTSASQFSSVHALAAGQAAKRLYALDVSANKIYGFDTTVPEAPTPLGGNFPIDVKAVVVGEGGVSYSDRLAVDNTGLSSAGNFYYSSANRGKIFGFDSSGNPLGGNFPVSVPNPGAEFDGLAVDPAGHLWVSDTKAKVIREYSSAGVPEGVSISTADVGQAYELAFDSNGDLYINAGASVGNESIRNAYKYTAASGYTSHVKVSESDAVLGLAVDTGAHQAYLSQSNSGFGLGSVTSPVDVSDSAGTLLYQFGAEIDFAVYWSLAIDQSTDSVFVWDEGAFEGTQGGISSGIHRQIVVFGGYGIEPVFGFDAPTGVSGTQATLNASVNSEGATPSECKFEYGPSKSYGQSVPCSGSIPADTSPHAVSAALSNLGPQSLYHYRISVKRGPATLRSDDATFSTVETFSTKAAAPVGDTSATVNGTVNLEGVPLSECKFEYGPTPLYGASKPCTPVAGSIPADFADHAVSAGLSGLMPQGAYHFRLVVTNANGTFAGKDEVFTAFGPPLVTEEEAAPVGETDATLLARVNPGGLATGYHFEWGADSSYGNRVPAEGEISAGSGSSAVAASTDLSGLSGDSTYHFRVVATNSSGTTNGPDQLFSTFRPNSSCPNAAIRAAQVSTAFPEGTIHLPNCMALEMVSPQKKFNQRSGSPQFSPSGEQAQFDGEGGLVDTPSLSFPSNPYVATRGPSGWTAHFVMPPAEISAGFNDAGRPCAYTPDFSHWATYGSTDLQTQLGTTVGLQGTLGGSPTPIGPPLTPLSGGVNGDGGTRSAITGGLCEGASTDATHIFYSIYDSAYLPGDPQVSNAGILDGYGNVYEAYLDEEGKPAARLLQRDRDGTVWGGRCGAQVGGSVVNDARTAHRRGSVSGDASRVYFSARPSQPEGVKCDQAANKLRIMEWQDTPTGPTIAPLYSSECTRVSPPCSGIDGDDEYQGASQEGTKLYFTTTRQLTNSDLDTTADLYLYDASRPEGERLTQVSAGDDTDPTPGKDSGFLGLAEFSGDGSRAYFVAEGVLTASPNLSGRQAELGKRNFYFYERDAAHPGGRTGFIGTLSASDNALGQGALWGDSPGEVNEARALPRLGADVEDLSVGGDGHILVFASKAPLSADDQDGGQPDVYRYDSLSGALERVSKADPGATDNGAFAARVLAGEVNPGVQSVSFLRTVSENGRTIVFASKEGLAPGAAGAESSDGEGILYIWRDGTLTVIPRAARGFGQVSMSGEQIGMGSDEKLLPEDGDSVNDAYVLRAGGGFPIVVPPAPCEGEACQGTPSPRPAEQGATSTAPTAGNAKESPPRPCRKGSVRRHGKCVKPRAKKQHHKRTKRAGHKQGGQK